MSALALQSEPGLEADPLVSIRARGLVSFTAGLSDGVTRRVNVREEGALRVRFPREQTGRLDAVLVNVAGGMAGGDYSKIEIEAQPGAHIVFTSTAAEKVYRALGDATCSDVRLMLGEGSRVAFLPQETILFDRVRLRRSIEIDMAPSARLALCDLVILGRAAMGEDVHTLDWADQWRLRRNGELLWADAARLQGDSTVRLAHKATGGGARAFGTLIYAAPDAETCLEPLRESLNRADNCQVGATAFEGLLVARFIAQDGQGARRAIEQALRALPDASPPRSWAT